MKKSALEMYLLGVCFVAVVAFVGTLTMNLYAIVRMAAPEFALSAEQYRQFQSNDSFWDVCIQDRTCSDVDEERPPEDELTEIRSEWLERAISTEEHLGIQLFVKSLIALLLEALVFTVHWRYSRYVHMKKSAAAAGDAQADGGKAIEHHAG